MTIFQLKRLPGVVSVLIAVQLAGCSFDASSDLPEPHTLEDAESRLAKGNERFAGFHAIHPDQGADRLHRIAKGQHPWAVVFSCSDSRVVPELVFDQGLGDLFTVRTAGNVVGTHELASVEYAVEHLHAPLVIVLGHTSCGAIEAYLAEPDEPCHGYMRELMAHLREEEEEKAVAADGTPLTLEEATLANIAHGVHALEHLLEELNASGHPVQARVRGALYHVENGSVEWVM
jgi:carbonic anhydrase